MKSLWIVLGVVALLIVVLLFIGGSYIGAKNTLVQKNEAVNTGLLAGRHRAATPSRSHPEPRRLRQRLRLRRVDHPDQHRQRPRRRPCRRQRSRQQHQRQLETRRSFGPLLPPAGAVPGPQGQSTVHALDGRTRRDGKSYRSRTPTLQRDAAGLQHLRPGSSPTASGQTWQDFTTGTSTSKAIPKTMWRRRSTSRSNEAN